MECPNCRTELQITFKDMEEYDGKVYMYYEGTCQKCERQWEWYDTYEFTETSYPCEIDNHDHL